MLPLATELYKVNDEMRSSLSKERIRHSVSLIPDAWLNHESSAERADAKKQVYIQFLETRLSISEIFVKEANDARKALI